ncbi:hypothetical protein CIT292_06690 [Citrobacter youngae ATCC 29220]|uniref:Uncharacterized protein n=1 Tax=Citrobacter youngae ATCC 29220 TaxID=500640 RepID=D4B655_9ENTR|nr:hypothetical protein CIT292_06690 [Citrobacter youngae ATCC 29220]
MKPFCFCQGYARNGNSTKSPATYVTYFIKQRFYLIKEAG